MGDHLLPKRESRGGLECVLGRGEVQVACTSVSQGEQRLEHTIQDEPVPLSRPYCVTATKKIPEHMEAPSI
jgi:hypothetical protein